MRKDSYFYEIKIREAARLKRTFGFLLRLMLRKTIIRNMLFSYLGLNVILLLSLGLLTIRDSTKTVTAEVTQASYKVMEQAASGFNYSLDEATRPLVILGGHYSVIALMQKGNRLPSEEKLQHERNISDILYGVYNFQSLISDILILGKNGYFNNLDGRKSLQWDYPFTDTPWFKQSVSGQASEGFLTLGVHTQDYYVPSTLSKLGKLTLSIAIPVFDYNRNTIGAVIANLNLEKIQGMFESGSYQKNESVFIIDDKRTIVVNKDSSAIGRTLDFKGIERLYDGDSGSFFADIDGKRMLVTYHPNAIQGWRMVSTIPVTDISKQSDRLRSNLGSLLYICLLLNVLISILITMQISRPFTKLLSTLDRTGEENLYVVSRNYRFYELNLIGNRFKELVLRIEQLVKQNYLSKIALQDTKMKTLQAQIHPHFLFNTLQQLQTEIVCGDTDNSNQLVVSLSNLLRYSMRQSDEMVELGEELRNMQDYLFIMNRKFDGRIEIDHDIPDPEVLRSPSLKLILQPIAENSLRHGFRDNPRSAKIQVGISGVGRKILIAIRDNGAGMSRERLKQIRGQLRDSSQDADRIGLFNVHQRIRLKYGGEYGVRI